MRTQITLKPINMTAVHLSMTMIFNPRALRSENCYGASTATSSTYKFELTPR